MGAGEGPGEGSEIRPHVMSHLRTLVEAHREKNPSNVEFATRQNSTTWVCVGSLPLTGSVFLRYGESGAVMRGICHSLFPSFLIVLLPGGIIFLTFFRLQRVYGTTETQYLFFSIIHSMMNQNMFSQHLIRFPGNGKADFLKMNLLSVCKSKTFPITYYKPVIPT